jgi:Flp pilus assembly protein TadG
VVTAELALGIPLLVAVSLATAWSLTVVVAQVRVVDAAREAARALARGDPALEASELARRVAPAGAAVVVTDQGDEVIVTVRVRLDPPGGGLLDLAGVTVRAEAVALAEASS